MSGLCNGVALKQLHLAWASNCHREAGDRRGGCNKGGQWQERLGGRSLFSFAKGLCNGVALKLLHLRHQLVEVQCKSKWKLLRIFNFVALAPIHVLNDGLQSQTLKSSLRHVVTRHNSSRGNVHIVRSKDSLNPAK